MKKETKQNILVSLVLGALVCGIVSIKIVQYRHDVKEREETFDHLNAVVAESLKQQSDEVDKAVAAANKMASDCMDLQTETLKWHRADITHNRTGEKGSIIIQMALYKSVTVTGKVFTVYLDAKPFDKEKRAKAAAQKEEEEANNRATAREIKHLTREIDKEMQRRYHPPTN